MTANSFLDYALSIQKIKKLEMPMPITKKLGMITPLLVGDDLSLKTTMSTPQTYDREICSLIFKHLLEWNDGNEITKPKSYDEFVMNLSNIDKICLLFGIYQITYDSLGKRKFKCQEKNCKEELIMDIPLKELVHDDSLTFWEEELPFNEFVYEFSIPYEDHVYIFGTQIPSIYTHNQVLSFLSTDDIASRIENLGSLFSLPEQMTLLTKYIKIGHKDDDINNYRQTNNIQEILITFATTISKKMQPEFFKNYNLKFGKYDPQFYINIVCPKCQKVQKRTVNIEIEFFRRSILGESSGEGGEEI